MTIADDIKESIEGNGCLPGKYDIKRMMANNEWGQLSKMFHFTPTLMLLPTGKWVLDWRCIPKRMADILRQDGKNFPQVHTRTQRAFTPSPRSKSEWNGNRRDVLYRLQGGICHYCKKKIDTTQWSVDHLTPLSRGGSNRRDNLVGACKTCNGKKACLTYEEFMATDYAPLHGGRHVEGKHNLKVVVKRIHAPLMSPKK